MLNEKRFYTFMVVAYLFSNGSALYTAILNLPDSRFFVTFYTLRLGFMIIACFFSFVRKCRQFYFPGFCEMSDYIYWRLVLLVMLSMKGACLHRFIDLPPTLKLLDFSVVVSLIIFLLMSYQAQLWAPKAYDKYNRSIAQLAGKAGLSKKELKAVLPILAETVSKRQYTPWPWKLVTLLLMIILGATLNSYASSLVDLVSSVFNFRNILPPF